MKLRTEKDIWDEVRKAERAHGDQAELVLIQRILDLTEAKEFEDASFWAAVAARLKNLHDIKLPGQALAESAAASTKV